MTKLRIKIFFHSEMVLRNPHIQSFVKSMNVYLKFVKRIMESVDTLLLPVWLLRVNSCRKRVMFFRFTESSVWNENVPFIQFKTAPFRNC